jgi:hypothetical protein
MCHGGDLRGAPPLQPDFPWGPNVTLYGTRPESQFVVTLRTGTTPDGRTLDAEHMPWNVYTRMTDEELGAIWRYLAELAGR